MASVTREGPTPNGGVKSTLYYLDAGDQETSEADAVKLLIVEYDAGGEPIHRTYAEVPTKNPDA